MSEVYSKIPKSEIDTRFSRLKDALRQRDIDGALFMTTIELYYYSGIGIDGALLVPVDDEPVRLVERNAELAKSYSQVSDVQPMGRLSGIFETLNVKPGSTLAVESDVIPHSLMKYLQSRAGETSLVDGSQIFRGIRSVKSPYEIAMIETAASIVDQSFIHCAEIAGPEMTEIDLSMRLDKWMVENGHAGFISTHGFNSEMLIFSYVVSSRGATLNTQFTPVSGYGLSLKYPSGPTRRKLGRNRPFLVDSCGNNHGYISDTTRTFIIGKFSKATREKLDALDQIKEFLEQKMIPDASLGALFGEVVELSKELGIYENFMGPRSDKAVFVGHGVGLELDELPVFYAKGPDLKLGNVLACEPKLIIPGEEVLGIEDTYAITESGAKLLSKAANRFEVN